MTKTYRTIGIVGGTGMLGKAIAVALLNGHVVGPERLWISNRRETLTHSQIIQV